MRVPLGPVAAVPDDACIAIGEGRAIVFRIGDTVCAYRNRCLHQDSPLAGGIVRNGVLSCPLHFWRYHADTGRLVGTRRDLQRYAVDIVDGEAFVELPDPPPPKSLREQLLERAQGYDRDAAYAAARTADADRRAETR
jgi:nitrite reductase/ring-hydroxylating ferredoxin subunit